MGSTMSAADVAEIVAAAFALVALVVALGAFGVLLLLLPVAAERDRRRAEGRRWDGSEL